MYISERIKLNKKLAKKGVGMGVWEYVLKNEEIIFKWDREIIENLLEDIFKKVDR